MSVMAEETPRPGSPEAIERGCRCPVLDNHHGMGFEIAGEPDRQFYINGDCPMHGFESSSDG